MKTNDISQLSAATALVQLLTERPHLAEHITWAISRTRPSLTGYVHDGGMAVLADCAGLLGGSIRAGHEYEDRRVRMRQHVLSAVWRDVPVEVVLSLAVAS